jgi:hypothetical protein
MAYTKRSYRVVQLKKMVSWWKEEDVVLYDDARELIGEAELFGVPSGNPLVGSTLPYTFGVKAPNIEEGQWRQLGKQRTTRNINACLGAYPSSHRTAIVESTARGMLRH